MSTTPKTLECLDCGWKYQWDPEDLGSDAASCPLCKELGRLVELRETEQRAETWRKYEASQRRWTNAVYALMALGVVWLFVVYPILRALD